MVGEGAMGFEIHDLIPLFLTVARKGRASTIDTSIVDACFYTIRKVVRNKCRK